MELRECFAAATPARASSRLEQMPHSAEAMTAGARSMLSALPVQCQPGMERKARGSRRWWRCAYRSESACGQLKDRCAARANDMLHPYPAERAQPVLTVIL